MKNPLKPIKDDQRGLATLIVAILIILLLSLIVLAMARQANRENREALDRQLSSQALYAAESGVNDMVKYLNSPDASGAASEKNDCSWSDTPGFDVARSTLDPSGPVSYTCILYDRAPGDLQALVKTSESWITPIKANEPIHSLKIFWHEANSSGEAVNSPRSDDCEGDLDTDFPRFDDYPNDDCDAGFLRVDLVNASSLDRNNLINRNFIGFLVPGRDSISTASISHNAGTGSAGQGIVRQVNCDRDERSNRQGLMCQAEITNIPADANLFLRMRSMYKQNNVVLKAYNADGDELSFVGAQVEIDATGKASDVLKRIQVRVPLSPQANFPFPEFGLMTTGHLCKSMKVWPGGARSETTSGTGLSTQCPLN